MLTNIPGECKAFTIMIVFGVPLIILTLSVFVQYVDFCNSNVPSYTIIKSHDGRKFNVSTLISELERLECNVGKDKLRHALNFTQMLLQIEKDVPKLNPMDAYRLKQFVGDRFFMIKKIEELEEKRKKVKSDVAHTYSKTIDEFIDTIFFELELLKLMNTYD